MKQRRLLSLLALVFLSWNAPAQNFVKRQGTRLILRESGEEIFLRGISFGNQVWDDTEIPTHHDEQDLRRVHEMGMNAVRFYMNYKTFEDDENPYVYKSRGWNWIDKNIAWAKKNQVYLILNFHVPQGGYQSMCKGDALWQDKTNQDRLVALWHAIALRYRDEPQIAGFDLVNEPTPSGSTKNWERLAQRIVDTIRTVDTNHLVIAERAIALGCDYGYNDGQYNYPLLDEPNMMYTMHFYDPYEYTTQNMVWANTGEGGKYPDESVLSAPSDQTWAYGQYNNPSVPAGTSDWNYYEGLPFKVDNDTVLLGKPVFYAHSLGAGKAYYDLITINEVTRAGQVIREIGRMDFKKKTEATFWSEKGNGTYGEALEGPEDLYAVTATGTTGYGTITVGSMSFKAEKGKYYQANAWLKGENLPEDAVVGATMEFYYSPSGKPLYVRNARYLRDRILEYSSYIRQKGLPVYVGEFGLVREDYTNGKGGTQWLKDVLHVFDSLGFHFTYHAYREESFGLYTGWGGPLDTTSVIVDLRDTFREYFGLPTGLQDRLSSNLSSVRLFPNPTAGTFRIVHPYGHPLHMEVVDPMGERCFAQEIAPSQGTLVALPSTPGVYFVQLSHQGQRTTFKVVKE